MSFSFQYQWTIYVCVCARPKSKQMKHEKYLEVEHACYRIWNLVVEFVENIRWKRILAAVATQLANNCAITKLRVNENMKTLI